MTRPAIEAMPEYIRLEEEEIKTASDKSLTDLVLHLNRIMRSQGRAVEQLHRRLDEAVAENALLGRQRDEANKNSQLQIDTTTHHIQQSRATETELVSEIRKLRGLLKRAHAMLPQSDLKTEIKKAL